MTRQHAYATFDIIQSVLFEVPATSLCGVTKIHTRESIDAAAAEPFKACRKCAKDLDVKKRDGAIGRDPQGWVPLLEGYMRRVLHGSPMSLVKTFKYTVGDVRGWDE